MKGRDDDGELYFATTTHRMQEVSVLLPAHIHRILDARKSPRSCLRIMPGTPGMQDACVPRTAVAAHCFNSGLVFADAHVIHASRFYIGIEQTLLAAVDSSVLLIARKRPILPTMIRWRGVSAAWRLHNSSALLALSDHHMLTPRTFTSLRTRDPHHCLFYSPLVCGPAGRCCSPHPIRNINLHPLQPGCTIRGLKIRILPGRKLCKTWGLGQKICKSWLTRRRRRRRRPSPSSFVLGHRNTWLAVGEHCLADLKLNGCGTAVVAVGLLSLLLHEIC